MDMALIENIALLSAHVVFTFALGYYSISAFQWYAYRFERVFFHYHRYDWHLFFFLLPIFMYYASGFYFIFFLVFVYLPMLYFWQKKLDKKLVFTSRVKRFFLFLLLATFFQNILCLTLPSCVRYGVLLPLFVSLFISSLFEKILFSGYKKMAKKKLQAKSDMIIIAITASYGKTSIKNFLYQILSHRYKCYATPRSVNTLGGIIKDINEDLPQDTQIYIVEAGARARGDIDEIAQLINPHYVIIGQIGEQHIEYFKTLQNIRDTKMELINSSNLKKAFVHVSAKTTANEKIILFGDALQKVDATLDGISFTCKLDDQSIDFFAPVLGSFHAVNLLACLHVSLELMDLASIQKALTALQSTPHRLQKIQARGKLIIDDSFNGNFDGMLASYELAKTYEGRKVLITPGIIESTPQANANLAKKIDLIFDLVIITGKSNQKILDANITRAEKIILKDKSALQQTLQDCTFSGDLILFSNDTPAFM
ncbi:MAG: UDP-N-acetylmuramoyl-tripeptide--D-alanyl-D-alanine ligase [Sulfurospirillum sp.]|nr:UDP-N-acetylmuramoyl-tripeptide--D-alanyl-D-alanine ligase [Sulfurospirillum sp.]